MPGGAWEVVAGVARRPSLWATALHQVRLLAVPGWWRSWPPLPAPDPAYVRFRLSTAYGDAAGPLRADDVVSYLSWCRAERAGERTRGRAERAGERAGGGAERAGERAGSAGTSDSGRATLPR